MKSKKEGISYENLMNSHFMRFPSHSKAVHTIFHPFLVAFVVALLATGYTWMKDGEAIFSAMVGGACAYLSFKMYIASSQLRGHGVGIIKMGKLSVLRMPSVLTTMYGILLFLLLVILVTSYAVPEGRHFDRVQIFSACALFSFIMSLLSWRFHIYYETWYGSEYDARAEFKRRGLSDKEVEAKVVLLKRNGIIG